MNKILIIDDDKELCTLIKRSVCAENIEADICNTGREGIQQLKEQEYQLVILDVMMPKMDGWQVCREIRVNSKVPIIMLTARGDERDELQGFQLGVDEYISKPFSPKILVARVEAILRRTNQLGQEEALTCGGITVDKAAHRVIIDGKDPRLMF